MRCSTELRSQMMSPPRLGADVTHRHSTSSKPGALFLGLKPAFTSFMLARAPAKPVGVAAVGHATAVGAGPRLLCRSVAGVEVSLRPLMWSSFVKFSRDDGLESLPPRKRLVVSLGPFAVLVAVGLLGGVPPGLLPTFVAHFFEGALQPFAVARPLLLASSEFAHAQPGQAFRRCCAFLGTLNLLPIPSLAGWQLVGIVAGRRLERTSLVGMFGFFLATVSWLVAFVTTAR